MIMKRNSFGLLLIAALLWLTSIPAYAKGKPETAMRNNTAAGKVLIDAAFEGNSHQNHSKIGILMPRR